ncbi:uncharacterized protein [Ptychodera flava]|uniref:uncharacterized protein n=1 Tax=Ptychodera flava TaxID=63121 RepID=UPI00396A9E7E
MTLVYKQRPVDADLQSHNHDDDDLNLMEPSEQSAIQRDMVPLSLAVTTIGGIPKFKLHQVHVDYHMCKRIFVFGEEKSLWKRRSSMELDLRMCKTGATTKKRV